MKVKQLIQKLNSLVEENPSNSEIEVRWYDDEKGRINRGDGLPIQLFENIYTREIYCVLNAVHNPPGFGMKMIPNNHKTFIV